MKQAFNKKLYRNQSTVNCCPFSIYLKQQRGGADLLWIEAFDSCNVEFLEAIDETLKSRSVLSFERLAKRELLVV